MIVVKKCIQFCNALSEMDVRGKMVGIPKPEQNRNIDVSEWIQIS